MKKNRVQRKIENNKLKQDNERLQKIDCLKDIKMKGNACLLIYIDMGDDE